MKILKNIILKNRNKFITQKENDFNDIITKINEFGKIINGCEIYKLNLEMEKIIM